MKSVTWEPAARADLRKLDREAAMRILLALTNYATTGQGNVKTLTDRQSS
jgi:mRNA-degrading endonuclease RelE of RelBE toxin-antitoxin system